MKIVLSTVVLPAVLVLFIAGQAEAQLFGERTLRGALSPFPQPGSAGGKVRGNERFVRGNRGVTDVVGVDRRAKRSFVGSLQRGNVTSRSAINGSRRRTRASRNLNPARPAPSKTGRYDPRLKVAFPFTSPAPQSTGDALSRQLRQAMDTTALRSIDVQMQGQTAILKGEVASGQDRILAGHLARFEPGVVSVRNELTIGPPAKTAPGGSDPNGR